MVDQNFWKNKKVFITGHTGFKGSWLSLWLQEMGANIYGYSLPPITNFNLFNLAKIENYMTSTLQDIGDFSTLSKAISSQEPEIVFHLASQPLVRASYENPLETYKTNVMGTVNLFEAIRKQKSIKSIIVITSDKCYKNNEWIWGYRENDPLGGRDPYSNSKACVELICESYRTSFFSNNKIGLATARAGNVIGGGDWSEDRLIPDILKTFDKKNKLYIRNPNATRPWQHVIEAISGYLILAQKLWQNSDEFSSAWNFGPPASATKSVEWIIKNLLSHYETKIEYELETKHQPHESQLLALDSTKANNLLGWNSKWSLEKTLEEIAKWHKSWLSGDDMREQSLKQINSYLNS